MRLGKSVTRLLATMAASAPAPPVAVFDPNAVTEHIPLIALRVAAKSCGRFLNDKALKSSLLNMPRRRNVIADVDAPSAGAGTKLVLLARAIQSLELADAPEALRAAAAEERAVAVAYTLTLGFADLATDEVLRRLLPAGLEAPTAFETVGHILHLNLRDELLPHKALVGAVLLAKGAPRVRTVVNKVESISNAFRVFPMELLAGEAAYEAVVRQNGCEFKLDYSAVYWNSRLEGEHARLVGKMGPRDVLLDMMAGIGPFAVPAAKKGVRVYANDLNPASHAWLCHNAARNRVEADLTPSCLDARAFLRAAAAGAGDAFAALPAELRARRARGGGGVHVAMNLPASAPEFLDCFRAAFPRALWPAGSLPTVHVYCFARTSHGDVDAAARDAREVCARVLGCGSLDGRSEVHVVRDVAPSKLMLCVSFALPEEVGWAADGAPAAAADGGDAQAAKRPRLTAEGAADAEPRARSPA